jgi:hypothetical protein
MNANDRTPSDGNTLLETFIAELTTAAYAVALRHTTRRSWLDLQLALWKALDETVTRWGQGRQEDDGRRLGLRWNPVPKFGRE